MTALGSMAEIPRPTIDFSAHAGQPDLGRRKWAHATAAASNSTSEHLIYRWSLALTGWELITPRQSQLRNAVSGNARVNCCIRWPSRRRIPNLRVAGSNPAGVTEGSCVGSEVCLQSSRQLDEVALIALTLNRRPGCFLSVAAFSCSLNGKMAGWLTSCESDMPRPWLSMTPCTKSSAISSETWIGLRATTSDPFSEPGFKPPTEPWI